MNFNKLIIARIKLLFRSVKAKRAKKKLLETFKNYPQSIRKLSAAYEKFLRAVRAEDKRYRVIYRKPQSKRNTVGNRYCLCA